MHSDDRQTGVTGSQRLNRLNDYILVLKRAPPFLFSMSYFVPDNKTVVLPGRNGERGWTDGTSLRRSIAFRASALNINTSEEPREQTGGGARMIDRRSRRR